MELTPTAKVIRPFWGRVAVLPSPVDEYQRASGLVVPDQYEGGPTTRRGVVIAIDNPHGAGPTHAALETLAVGDVVWYRKGWEIRDTVILDPDDIIATEVDS